MGVFLQEDTRFLTKNEIYIVLRFWRLKREELIKFCESLVLFFVCSVSFLLNSVSSLAEHVLRLPTPSF